MYLVSKETHRHLKSSNFQQVKRRKMDSEDTNLGPVSDIMKRFTDLEMHAESIGMRYAVFVHIVIGRITATLLEKYSIKYTVQTIDEAIESGKNLYRNNS